MDPSDEIFSNPGTTQKSDNKDIDDAKMLNDIEELFRLRQQNYALENKLAIMEEQKKLWNGIRSHLIKQANKQEASTKKTLYDSINESSISDAQNLYRTSESNRNLFEHSFKVRNHSILIRAQIKILASSSYLGLQQLNNEMKQINSTKIFNTELQKVLKEQFYLRKCDYRYIINFYLKLVKNYVKSQMPKILHKRIKRVKAKNNKKESLNKGLMNSCSHLSTKHEKFNSKACLVCKGIFQNKLLLFEHYKIRHKIDLSDIKFVKVNIPLKKFNQLNENTTMVKEQNKVSISRLSLSCKLCKQIFGSNAFLHKHYNIRHNLDLLKNKFVNVEIHVKKSAQSFKKPSVCVESRKIVSNETFVHSCLVCGQVFRNKCNVLEHYEIKHKMDLTGMRLLYTKIDLLKQNIKIALLKLNQRFEHTLDMSENI